MNHIRNWLVRLLLGRIFVPTPPLPTEPADKSASQTELLRRTQRDTQRLIEELGIRTEVETIRKSFKHGSQ